MNNVKFGILCLMSVCMAAINSWLFAQDIDNGWGIVSLGLIAYIVYDALKEINS